MGTPKLTDAVPAGENPTGLRGIRFVVWSAPTEEGLDRLDALFLGFGFSKIMQHRDADIDLYKQNDMLFLLDRRTDGFNADFAREHGPSISAMGWQVDDPTAAWDAATARGARAYQGPHDYTDATAIYGIGDSLIWFVGAEDDILTDFQEHAAPVVVKDKGFLCIDHLTNNVEQGTMERWQRFYKDVFGFTEVRTFDIRGEKTGLTSYALRSPDGSFCIPINEGSEEKSQIEEYLREYKGAGVQHLAFLSDDLLASLDALDGSGIETLDIDDEYYRTVYDRVPGVTEDRGRIKDHQVLVDGDDDGYLLQIFTRNLVGPIFIEMIQRKNHLSFGEGNFGALFRSIERDQERRGVL